MVIDKVRVLSTIQKITAEKIPPVTKYVLTNFEEGIDATPLAIGTTPDVDYIKGEPLYSADAAIHNSMGVSIPVSSGSTLFGFPMLNTIQASYSIYFTVNTIGTSRAPFARIADSDYNGLLDINFRAGGHYSITDSDGNTVASTTTAAFTVNTPGRADFQHFFTGTQLTLTVRFFANAEDSVPVESISATVATSDVAKVALGTPPAGADWAFGLDTFRRYYDAAVWPLPYGGGGSSTPAVEWSWVGDPTADGVVISSKVDACTSVKMLVSLSPDMSSPTTFAAQTPDSYGLVRHTVTGQKANSKFYYQLVNTVGGVDTPLGTPTLTNTIPAVGSDDTQTWAVISCQRGNSVVGQVLDDIRTVWKPQATIHLGDFHYKGILSKKVDSHLRGYSSQILAAAGLKQLCATNPMFYITSDHETSANNGDSLQGTAGGDATQANINAYLQLIPYRNLADVRNPIKGRYRTWVVGRVRYIMVDIRNLERSIGTDADSSSKTMLGATQVAWLKTQLQQTEPLKVIVSDTQWMGDAGSGPYAPKDSDKWWSYPTARAEIYNFINNNTTTDGQPIRVDFWGGDTHLLGVADDKANTWGGFPVLCCSPIDQHPLTSFQDLYDEYYNDGGVNDDSIVLAQYMRITIEDQGNKIVRTAVGIDMMQLNDDGNYGKEVVSQVFTWDV